MKKLSRQKQNKLARQNEFKLAAIKKILEFDVAYIKQQFDLNRCWVEIGLERPRSLPPEVIKKLNLQKRKAKR